MAGAAPPSLSVKRPPLHTAASLSPSVTTLPHVLRICSPGIPCDVLYRVTYPYGRCEDFSVKIALVLIFLHTLGKCLELQASTTPIPHPRKQLYTKRRRHRFLTRQCADHLVLEAHRNLPAAVTASGDALTVDQLPGFGLTLDGPNVFFYILPGRGERGTTHSPFRP